MNNKNKLKENIIYNALYQVLILIIPLLTMPYLTRVLTVDQLGINSYTISIVQLFLILSFFGIKNYGGREIALLRDNVERNKGFWSLWFIQIFWSIVSYLILLVTIPFLFEEYRTFMIIQGMLILVNAAEISWFFVGIEELKRVVVRNTTIKLLVTMLIFILVRDSSDFMIYISLNVVSTLVGNMVLIKSLRQYISKPIIDLNDIWRHMKKSSVFLLPQLATLIYTTFDRTILGTLSTMEQVGFYDQAQKIVRVAIGLISSVGLAIMPRMTMYVRDNDWGGFETLFSHLIKNMMLISFYIVLIIMCTSHTFVYWFFGEAYASVGSLMQLTAIIGICIPFATILWNTLLIPMRQDKIAIKSAVYSALISLTFNIILIGIFKLGALGAVITLCIAEMYGMLYRVYYADKYYSLKKYYVPFFKYVVILLIVTSIIRILTVSLAPTFITTVIQGLGASALYVLGLTVIEREFVVSTIKTLKLKFKR